MSDEQNSTPTPPPPPPPAPAAGPPSGGKSDNTAMLVLSYLWLLCLIPMLTEKDDAEVQWHSKNGLCLFLAEVVLYIAFLVVSFVLTAIFAPLGCLLSIGTFLVWIGLLIVHIVAIVKATKGERFIIPVVTDFVEKF